jgi:hypothetical protein
MSDSPTFDVEQRANAAYVAKQWAEAEQLYREVLSTSDQQGRQIARNMLGSICERQQREHEAAATPPGAGQAQPLPASPGSRLT